MTAPRCQDAELVPPASRWTRPVLPPLPPFVLVRVPPALARALCDSPARRAPGCWCGLARVGPGVRVLGDKWTVVTLDAKPSAHFEHTVLITKGEPEILTWRKKTLLK